MNTSIKEKLHSLPLCSGVYLMKDKFGNVIYVGKAKNLKRRVNSYFIGSDKPIKTHNLVQNIADFDYIVVASETDAFMLENNLIKKYQPHYNILLKDSKTFPYLKINLNDNFPKVEKTRKIKKDGAKYFGPYFNGISIDQIQKIIQETYNLRNCNLKISSQKKPARPCLNYSLGLCTAPCAQLVSQEQYSQQVNGVIDFLKGDTKKVEQILRQKMERASELTNFEKAIELREMLKSVNNLKRQNLTQFSTVFDQDVVGYYSTGTDAVLTVMILRGGKLMAVENFSMIDLHDFSQVAGNFLMQYYSNDRTIPKTIVLPAQIEDAQVLQEYLSKKIDSKVSLIVAEKGKNKKLCQIASQNGKEYLEKSLGLIRTKEMRTLGAIKRLQQVLNLSCVPYRMECYDISNISGTNSVASMVVFLNGDVAKTQYRKFVIKTVDGADDFASLKEVLARRIAELHSGKDESFLSRPNLIVVDGGKGQLSAVNDILLQLGEQIDCCSLAKQDEEIFVPNQTEPIKLKKSDVALQVLQRIRDESHRFAIMFHRKKRSRAMTKSVLDDVRGIGKVKKQQLFERFGTIENIAHASIEELQLVKGITRAEAEQIKKLLAGKQN